jgi:hypothetical protein
MDQNSNSLNSSLQLTDVKGEVAFGHRGTPIIWKYKKRYANE